MTTPGSTLPHTDVEQLKLFANKIGDSLIWENKQDGPSHNPVFTFWARIGERTFPHGQGKTKKEAKYNAAKMALEILGSQNVDMPHGTTTPLTSPAGMGNYISKLNEYGQKNSKHVEYITKQLDTGLDHVQKFSSGVVIDKKIYPIGYGKSKQDAKGEGARLALEEIYHSPSLCKDLSNLDIEKDEEFKSISEDSVGQDSQSSKEDQTDENGRMSEDSTFTCMDGASGHTSSGMQNPVGALNEYCQKTKLSCYVEEVNKRGLAHSPEFTLQYVVEGKKFPSASAENKQKARRKAAILALKELKQTQDELGRVSSDGLFLRRSSELSSGSSFIIFEGTKPLTNAEPTGGTKSKRRLAPTFNATDTENSLTSSQSKNDKKDEDMEMIATGFSDFKYIGEGSFGCVYKAKNIVDKKYYAIKEVLLKNEKTTREAQSLAKVEHKNIVRYHHSWIGKSFNVSSQNRDRIEQSLFIQMELYEKNLKEWLMDSANSKPDQKKVALSIFNQLLDGVIYIHQNKMIHRDLKPANIFLKENGIVKIGDFGLVITMNDQDSLTRGTGTPVYMSPEQLKLEKYNHKVDIFALGLIFFELLWIQIGTVMERAEKWREIRTGNFPRAFDRNYTIQSPLIRKMLSEAASERPEAKDIKLRLESNEIQESKTV
ncbi:interferon-induced, double-stranded RNA-activated protein kinase [Scyliorhinus canicula]|uniref:interferon-induced, double-stranded RNA-activated protein kinase n=1 Tax=Scyliorhinus canicula TaxID=7830 RepID=UPI0018F2D12A|nr:interferon-induced, double-stranded RNA-activated protein kinase [Scyliorhinus canicula]